MELLREKLKKRREADEKAQQEHGDNEQDDQKENKSEKWGYDMYPERRGIFKQDLLKTLTLKEGRETTEKMVCERNVYNCVMKSPLVKIMMGALKASGWYDSKSNGLIRKQTLALYNSIIFPFAALSIYDGTYRVKYVTQ